MTNPVKMTTIAGIRMAQKVAERSFRDVPGTPIAVTQIGNIRLDDDILEMDRFPYVLVFGEDGLYRVHVPAAVATVWLTPTQRDIIRAKLPVDVAKQSPEVDTLARELAVWHWAITHVASTTEEDLTLVSAVPEHSWAGVTPTRVETVIPDDYTTILVEKYRPPSKGGNTSAMYSHAITIAGDRYSWLARGAKKWIFAKDRVSFDFFVTPEGYRNIIPQSIVTVDAAGKVVTRGDRRQKRLWRSAPTRLPGSRREARD